VDNFYLSSAERLYQIHPRQFKAVFDDQSKLSRVFHKSGKWVHQIKITMLWVTDSSFPSEQEALQRQRLHLESRTMTILESKNIA
jgi:hypothetical protein